MLGPIKVIRATRETAMRCKRDGLNTWQGVHGFVP